MILLYPTVICSKGYFEIFFFVLDIAAYIRVKPPTLPQNIKSIKIS